jgi:hypothetical protein
MDPAARRQNDVGFLRDQIRGYGEFQMGIRWADEFEIFSGFNGLQSG